MIKQPKINQEINADKVLLIDEEGVQQGVVSRDQALYLSFEKGLDLVLLNEKQDPPIARIMDYGKYLYSQQKQTNKQKAKSKNSQLKEVRMGIKIGEHDLNVKVEKIKNFLSDGDKVKVTVQLRGREMMFREKVSGLLEKIRLESNAIFEKPLEALGNRFSVVLAKNKENNEVKNSQNSA